MRNRQVQPQKNEKNDCVMCNIDVLPSEFAVQCDKCDLWTHCSCASISNTLYKCLKTSRTPMIKLLCIRCIAADAAVAADEKECCNHIAVESTMEDLNETCIPVAPVLQILLHILQISFLSRSLQTYLKTRSSHLLTRYRGIL